jgi:hypothetical protein
MLEHEDRICALEKAVFVLGSATVPPQAVEHEMASAIALTRQLFGDGIVVEDSYDPEFSDDRQIVFTITTGLGPAEVVQLESEWARSIGTVAPHLSSLRLLILAE